MVLKQLQKLTNVLQKKLDKIEVDSNRCAKVRATISNCSACLDVCPNNSINITMDCIELKPSCIDCGLCTSVCVTNALKYNDPPLEQLLNQLINLSSKEEVVYIGCPSSLAMKLSNSIVVPCLGSLPKEFWINLGMDYTNVQVVYQSEVCNGCELKNGEKLFINNMKEFQKIVKFPFPICSTINSKNIQPKTDIDHNKRRFLMNLLEDVKETNTHVVSEVLEAEKILSPFEKFDQYYQTKDELDELAEQVNGIKNSAMDQLLNYSLNYTDKRNLLLRAFVKQPNLQEEMSFAIPQIKESCTKCGACSFLCPTNAIHLDADKSMVLLTNKCVSCNLCVEICYEKHISMDIKNGSVFNEKFLYLIQ